MVSLGRALTELEGAVLTEIAHRGNRTAFKVRRAFASSPSAFWSGSAGAVYPAIRRLVEAGLLHAESAAGGRGTRLLSLSTRGRSALASWSCDAPAACALGFDPFRLRSGLWRYLPPRQRSDLIASLRARLEAELAQLHARADGDEVDRIQTRFAVDLQMLRLAWLDGFEREGRAAP